jgi:alpha-L-rhamnosidase
MVTTWSAHLIGSEEHPQAPLLRFEFEPDAGHGEIVSALWRVSAHGVVEASVNGVPASSDVLTPGWSSYEWRLRYRSYDVATLVKKAGPSVVLGLALGNGWFRGRLGWSGRGDFYGDRLGAIAELDLVFADGHQQTIGTDERWTAGPSAVLADDLYDGQTIDARLLSTAWQQPGFSDPAWTAAEVQPFDTGKLTPYVGPPVVRHEEIRPVKIWKSPGGATLVDFGQNLVGWLKFTVRGDAGQTITLRHAEVLEHGELGTRPLRTAKATDTFILSGGEDTFEPTFTFHGFRYASVEGWPGELTEDSLVAVVVSSDLQRIGTFECSDPMLNQLHSNVVWGQRGNFLDVPTDCPQRDERLGWTGDLAVFSPTAVYLYDSSAFLRDWLRDLDAEQAHQDGMVPYVVPDMMKFTEPRPGRGPQDSTSFWSDAAVWVPWAMWQAYGQPEVLADAYGAMTAHVRRVEGKLSDRGLWDSGFQFADWLDPTAPPDNPLLAKADPGVVSTAAIYRSSVLVAEAARVLGRQADAEHFDALADRLRTAFNEHYVSDDGRVLSDCPTVYALAIAFGLLDEPRRQRAGDRLAELVEANGYRIATGFAGTPYVTDALTSTGHLDDAYRLLLQQECPSWLYSVSMGATTIWERWDSMLPDGSINPGQMTSFNHYALGAVADWLHRTVAGLAPAEPGYRKVRVAPQPGGGLTWAKASLRTPHGEVTVAWELTDGELSCQVTLPEGVTADVDLPGATPRTVTGSGTTSLRSRLPEEAYS